MLAGGVYTPGYPDDFGSMDFSIRRYDPSDGGGERLCSIPHFFANPVAAFAFGHVCLYDIDYLTLYVLNEDLSDGDMIEIEAPTHDPNADPDVIQNISTTQFSFTGDENMLVLTFTYYYGGISADTFILKEGENAFTPLQQKGL